MPTSDAQKKATIKYMKENLEEVRFRVKKGGKEQIQITAKDKGHGSIQAYMKHLIKQDSGIDL